MTGKIDRRRRWKNHHKQWHLTEAKDTIGWASALRPLKKYVYEQDQRPQSLDYLLKVSGDELDDLADAIRYGVMTWRLQGERPRQGADSKWCGVSTNDLIGLESFTDYTLDEFIGDRASEGVNVISRNGCHLFF